MEGATGVLLSFAGGGDLGLFEVNEAASLVESLADEDANIIFGTIVDDSLGDEVRVTVIATGFDDSANVAAVPSRGAHRAPEPVPAEQTVEQPSVPSAAEPPSADRQAAPTPSYQGIFGEDAAPRRARPVRDLPQDSRTGARDGLFTSSREESRDRRREEDDDLELPDFF
jgi:cell division protein FtsZ